MIIGYSRRFSVPISTPVSLVTGADGTIQSTFSTSSISPTANALIIVGMGARADTQAKTVFGNPTAGFGTTGSWVLRQSQYNDGVRWICGAIAMIRADGSPGSGTVTLNHGGSAWNRVVRVLEVPLGFDADPSSYPYDTNEGASTSLALDLGGTPVATSLIVSQLIHHTGNAGSFTIPSGHTGFAAVDQSTNLASKMSYKLLSGAQTQTWTGLDNTEGSVGTSVEVLQA